MIRIPMDAQPWPDTSEFDEWVCAHVHGAAVLRSSLAGTLDAISCKEVCHSSAHEIVAAH